jgi:hypothetical protein
MSKLIDTLSAYKRVITDLEGQAPTYEENALDDTLGTLKHRVWEIENVFADVLAEELKSLELSKARHPSNFVKDLFPKNTAE